MKKFVINFTFVLLFSNKCLCDCPKYGSETDSIKTYEDGTLVNGVWTVPKSSVTSNNMILS